MHILILGGGGMVGRKLAERLARDGALGGRPVGHLTLHDVVEPQCVGVPEMVAERVDQVAIVRLPLPLGVQRGRARGF